MKRNLIILTLFVPVMAIPLFIGCDQEEKEIFDGQEFETLANRKKTRAGDVVEGNIMRVRGGSRQMNLHDEVFTAQFELKWKTGSLTRGTPPKISYSDLECEVNDTTEDKILRQSLSTQWTGSCHIDVTMEIWYYKLADFPSGVEPDKDDPKIKYDAIKDDVVVELEPDPNY